MMKRCTTYLTHVVICSDKETTKVRVVHDASAKSSGPSLNNCLCTGPKFDQKILDILLRFHFRKVALTADIEKAFLMISVDEPTVMCCVLCGSVTSIKNPK